jgi:hypothetical protein
MVDILSSVRLVLHRIRVKLFPAHLPGQEGDWVARTDSEKVLFIEDVAASASRNGRFEGDVEHLVEHVQVFIREAAHLLCDGFAVSFRLFSVHPHVTGLFKSKREGVSEEEHPIEFRFRVLNELRQLVKYIEVFVEGVASDVAWIDEFHDVETDTINEMITPKGLYALTGAMLRVEGEGSGVWFVSNDKVPEVSIKAGKLVDNTSTRLAGNVPNLLTDRTWFIEVRTHYTGGKELKELRVITSEFKLTAAVPNTETPDTETPTEDAAV